MMNTMKLMRGALLASSVLLAPSAAFAQQADSEAASASNQVEDVVVVRYQYVPEPQRRTAQVASFLSAEDLARTGDSDAAAALARVSGLSIVGGRFAYVRGLGDRYSSSLLNGSVLPSPEPLRRTVPLDLIPSDLLDGIEVQKTYSANLPAEFGGGLINMSTVRRPDEDFFSLKAGVSYNSEATFQDGLTHSGADQDWTGYDDGLRSMPSPLADLIATRTPLNTQSDEYIENAGESLTNSPVNVIQNTEYLPTGSFSFEAGASRMLGQLEVGVVATAGYDSDWSYREANRQRVLGGIIGNDQTAVEGRFEAATNALVALSAGLDNHEVQGLVFYSHDTDKRSEITTGTDFNAPGATGEIHDEQTGWYERELTMYQLNGEHVFGDLELSWRGAYAESTRDAPYERTLRRLIDPVTGQPSYLVANSYDIRFSDLTDEATSFGGDALYNLDLMGWDTVLSAGFDTSSTEREYNLYAFRFVGGNSLPDDVRVARPDFLFSPDNIAPTRFILQELSTTNDSYTGELDVDAYYAQADVEFTDFIRATFGVRREEATQSVQTFDRFGNLGAGTVDLENEYTLPAFTGTWTFAENLQLRVGYSETIARPQFRELARSSYFDPESGRAYRGNSGLVDTEFKNYDARVEYYLGRDQFITGAVFYKELTNPIEEVQFSTSTFVFETTFINSPKAVVQGLELEYRTQFNIPGDIFFLSDRDWRFGVNYTYTDSEVEAGDGDLIFDPISQSLQPAATYNLDGSVLQGTPENIINAQLGWASDQDEFNLLLNWVDDRVLQRGLSQPGAELPDVMEDPGVILDATYRRDLNYIYEGLSLSINARNLLDEDHIEYQVSEGIGETQFNTYARGRSVSVSLTARF
ncbi:TonB-dependent receptor domain-containing protein [Oceanicaulis sp.]|uniref:TonB-dependent receptor domain-containing protein n=1 Tax=Oceanicaulis sp. TaxID=1924941 RepID=UPI003BAB07CE